MFLGEPQESVEAERVLANMGVNVERDFRAGRGHFGKGRHADGNVIADAVGFDDGLVRMFRQQRSSKMRNHRRYRTVRSVNKDAFVLSFPQEVPPLHSFYTTEA